VRGCLEIQAGGAADEGVVAFVETKVAVGRARDANADADAEQFSQRGGAGSRWGRRCELAEPERTACAQIDAIEAAIDFKGFGQTPRPAREVAKPEGTAAALHVLYPLEGLQGTDQDATACTGPFSGDVEHEVVAVSEIDVGETAVKKHGAIAGSLAAKMVRRGVLGRIAFGFDDSSAQPTLGKLANDHFADEKSCHGDGINRKFGAMQSAHRQLIGGFAL